MNIVKNNKPISRVFMVKYKEYTANTGYIQCSHDSLVP